MANYYKNNEIKENKPIYVPFKIVSWTGEQTGLYMVQAGTIFSSFNYAINSYVPINGLNSGFEWKANHKVYLDMVISPNLQVSGCGISISQVGVAAGEPSDQMIPDKWVDYPGMFRIVPKDQYNNDGILTQIAEGKRETKCYLLIGYRSDDTDIGGSGNATPPPDNNPFTIVQKLDTNVMMMHGQHSGAYVTFPIPWFRSIYPEDMASF